MLQGDRFDHRMHHGEAEPARPAIFMSAGVLDFAPIRAGCLARQTTFRAAIAPPCFRSEQCGGLWSDLGNLRRSFSASGGIAQKVTLERPRR